MAATAPSGSAPASTAQRGIPGFDKLSDVVYLHRPGARKSSASSDSSPAKSPRLIVLAGWMGAREPHLAKYTARLQAMYPRSPIVVLRSYVYHFTTRASSHPREVAAAVPVIRSILADHEGEEQQEEEGDAPAMLVHLFSNGGSAALRHLREQYAASSPPPSSRGGKAGGGSELPPHVTVYDSAPGKFQWQRSVTAFMASAARINVLARLAVRALASCLFALYWAAHALPWAGPGYLDVTWLSHNDRRANAAELRRAYVYSEEDALVDYRDVEEHAASAVRGGFAVVALEKFRGSAHVAHVRVDEARYWGVVRDAWENAARRQGESGWTHSQ